jgi:predicted solute-binding protein
MTKQKVRKKRVSVDNSLASRPLIYGLTGTQFEHRFNLHLSAQDICAEQLRQGASDLALISAADYARKKETWFIVPDLCIAAHAASKKIQLFFNSGLRDIRRIAVPNLNSTETILLKIILQEGHELNPEYIEDTGELEHQLSKADAALQVNDDALDNYNKNRNRLDLNEEWVDLTSRPFVYSIWAGREFLIQKEDLIAVKMSHELGMRNTEIICKNHAEDRPEDWGFYHDFLTKDLNYIFTDAEKEGLAEFFSYAFFFGLLEYIPDFHFFTL